MAFRYLDRFLDRILVKRSDCGIYEELFPAGKYEQPSNARSRPQGERSSEVRTLVRDNCALKDSRSLYMEVIC
jgi:hypothetical protein